MTNHDVNKRGEAAIIGTVLLILAVVVSGGIVAYYTVQQVQSIDSSCLDAIKAIDFKDLGYSCTMQGSGGDKLTAFSILVASEDIEGFDLSVGEEGGARTYQVKTGTQAADLCLLTSHFGEALSVPAAGNSRTYIVKGEASKISISPILKGGKSCYAEAHKDIVISDSCVNPEVKNALSACVAAPSTCGNHQADVGEDCEAGVGIWTSSCIPTYGSSCQYCDPSCHIQTNQGGSCGDGVVNGPEECDDHNTQSGDGCSSTCQNEPCMLSNARWESLNAREGDSVRPSVDVSAGCAGQSILFRIFEDEQAATAISASVQPADVIATGASTSARGTWITEWIDDSLTNCATGNCNPDEYYFIASINDTNSTNSTNSTNGTSMSSTLPASELTVTACGDNILNGLEQCDGGVGAATCSSVSGGTLTGGPLGCYVRGHLSSSGGSDQCTYDTHLCTGSATCGNGLIETGEQCDDHDSQSGDGCSSTCQVESGWSCSGAPSICTQCGNGHLDSGESCDGSDFGSATCGSLGFSGGSLTCSASCQIGTGSCSVCGDGAITSGESCDTNYQGGSCTTGGVTTGGTDTGTGTTTGNVINGRATGSSGSGSSGTEGGPGQCASDCHSCQAAGLNGGSWGQLSAVEGQLITMTANGQNIGGLTLDFNVYEDDSPFGSTLVTPLPLQVSVPQGASSATTFFTAVWECDGNLAGICTTDPPEYYFKAKIHGTSIEVTSSGGELITSAASATCGNGILQSGEECEAGVGGMSASCNPAYGSSCQYCDPSCHIQTNQGARCGDGSRNGPEVCDGGDLAGQSCTSRGFIGGTLACRTDCSAFDTTGCFNQVCGNGVREGSEQCDSSDLGGQSCSSLGFAGGSLSCSGACTFNTASCTTGQVCGNGVREGSEVCDPAGSACGGATTGGTDTPNSDGATSTTTGNVINGRATGSSGSSGSGSSGTCSADCMQCTPNAPNPSLTSVTWSSSTAVEGDPATIAVAGTNVATLPLQVEVWEDDGGIGDDFISSASASFDAAGGTISLSYPVPWQCDGGELFGYCLWGDPEYYVIARITGMPSTEIRSGLIVVTQRSPECGNGFVQGSEQCDPPEAACTPTYGSSCQYCAGSCNYATVQGGSCGDGIISGPEQCDGLNLNGRSCSTFGFAGGSLSCAAGCLTFDTSQCTSSSCGNGVREGSEQCDGSDFGGASTTCTSYTHNPPYTSGSLTCSGCVISQSSCGYCGDGVVNGGEQCEGTQQASCPVSGGGGIPNGASGSGTTGAVISGRAGSTSGQTKTCNPSTCQWGPCQ